MIFKDEDVQVLRRSRLVVLAAALLAIIGISVTALAAPNTGEAAPSLVVQELNGQTFDLNAARGKVVVINFWATWCPPCREEMPALNAFYTRYHGEGLELLGLSADRPHDRSDVIKVMQAFSYPAAMLHDAKVDGFGEPSSLPMTFVVDREGIIRAKLTSDTAPATEKTLADLVLPFLSNKQETQSSPKSVQ